MCKQNIVILILGCSAVSILAGPKKKIPCALDDFQCTKLTVDPLFKSILKGRPDLKVPGSEPLRQVEISGRFKDMFYNLTDAELHGMASCQVKDHSINILQLSWSALLHCPKLVLKSDYEIFGAIGDMPIEGKGQCNIEYEKCRVGLHGGFDFVISTKGRPHMSIKHFNLNRFEVVGNIKSEFSNLYNGDITKSEVMHKYLNENQKNIGIFDQYPTIRSFMEKMFENINVYLRAVPANELFFREV